MLPYALPQGGATCSADSPWATRPCSTSATLGATSDPLPTPLIAQCRPLLLQAGRGLLRGQSATQLCLILFQSHSGLRVGRGSCRVRLNMKLNMKLIHVPVPVFQFIIGVSHLFH